MKRYVTRPTLRKVSELLETSKFTEARILDSVGHFLERLSTDDAIAKYGNYEVSNSYSESADCVSIWII